LAAGVLPNLQVLVLTGGRGTDPPRGPLPPDTDLPKLKELTVDNSPSKTFHQGLSLPKLTKLTVIYGQDDIATSLADALRRGTAFPELQSLTLGLDLSDAVLERLVNALPTTLQHLDLEPMRSSIDDVMAEAIRAALPNGAMFDLP
jgi:hypothetical protein